MAALWINCGKAAKVAKLKMGIEAKGSSLLGVCLRKEIERSKVKVPRCLSISHVCVPEKC